MSDIEPINDEWLHDIRGLAYRDEDGPQVIVSRLGMKRLISRLEVAESLLVAAGAARGEQNAPKVEEQAAPASEPTWQLQVMSTKVEAKPRKLKAVEPHIEGPALEAPICIEGRIPMMMLSYENRLATYVCTHCQKKVVLGVRP